MANCPVQRRGFCVCVVRALAIPPRPWQFPAKVEGKDSLKVDPMPGYLGDLAEEPIVDSQGVDEDIERFHREMTEHAQPPKGGKTSLAEPAGGAPPSWKENLNPKETEVSH